MAETDQALFIWLNGHTGTLNGLDISAKVLGSDYAMPVIFGLVILSMWFFGNDPSDRMRHQIGVFVTLTAIGIASWIVYGANELYFRPSPFDSTIQDINLLLYEPTDSSFPSNSAAIAFAAAGGIWLVNRKCGLSLLGLAFAYGLARIYGGMHYPLDIVGGASVGLLSVVISHKLWKLIDPIPKILIRIARIFCVA